MNVPTRMAWSFGLLASALLAACGGSAAVQPEAAPAGVTVTLIALNDLHGYLRPPASTTALPAAEPGKTVGIPLGGAAYLATEVRALKALNPNHIVVGAGDLIGASPLESSLFHDEPAIAALDAIGLELSSVGNHEFDRGRAGLLRMQQGGCAPDGRVGEDSCVGGVYRGAQFHYLAANVVDEASGKPILPSYEIRQFSTASASVRIAFIGLVLKGTPEIVARAGIAGLRFDDEADTVNALLPAIRAQGAHSIVVLIHEGGRSTGSYNDQTCPGFTGKIIGIVNRLDPAVTAVVSAHTHQAYVCRLASRDPAHRILVTSAGSYGRFVTDIDLAIDPISDEVIGVTANNIAVVNDSAPNPVPLLYPPLAADAALAALVDEYIQRAAPITERIVGHVSADLLRETDAAGESVLGNVIADALLEATRAKERGGAQIAFMNIGGVRADLLRHAPEGGVNYGQIYMAQPFGGHSLTMTLSGTQLHALLEAQWRADGSDAILLPSAGFSYAWKASAPPGAKIDPASIRLDGKPVEAEGRYRVSVNNFLADGGDGFKTFTEGSERQDFDKLDRDLLIDYLAQHSPLAPPEPGRRIRRLD